MKITHVVLSPSVADPADEFGACLFYGVGRESESGYVRYLSVTVSEDYVKKHQPKVGGYYVRYEDGYESFSPAEAFEGGYKKIHEGTLHVWTFVTETGKRFEVLTDKMITPKMTGDLKIIDAHEVESFDWAALQRLRKESK